MPVSDDCHAETINYRQKYRNLKKKLRYLIYENECFQDELRKAQRKLLKVNQDKSFLLDRLLQYEKIEESSSDSDVTLSSDSEIENFALKKKKASSAATSNSHHFAGVGTSNSTAATRTHTASSEPAPKRKKPSAKSPKTGAGSATGNGGGSSSSVVVGAVPPVTIKTEPEECVMPLSQGDGHMTSEEIERHLESRQILMDLVPERAPPTVPTEMFSNDVTCLERFMMADDDD